MFVKSIKDLVVWGVLICILTICFFTFNTILNGNRGLIAKIKLQDELAELHNELAAQEEEMARINTKLNHFSTENLDLDLLDEVAREKLAYIHISEIIIQ